MQRIFTEDVLNSDGNVKFPVGMIRDFPRVTWNNIQKHAGKSLSEFTEVPPEAFGIDARRRTSVPSVKETVAPIVADQPRSERKKLTRKETG